MDEHQPGLAELRLQYLNHAVGQIGVAEGQVDLRNEPSLNVSQRKYSQAVRANQAVTAIIAMGLVLPWRREYSIFLLRPPPTQRRPPTPECGLRSSLRWVWDPRSRIFG